MAKNMNIHFTIKSDFPFPKQHDTNDNNGCACEQLSEAWVFLDGLLSESNLSNMDIVEQCFRCTSSKKKNCHPHDVYVKVYVQEINRVTIHELLHLCGLSEQQLGIDHELYHFWFCPEFLKATHSNGVS